MPFESLTDEKIAQLLSCPKRMTNPQARSKTKEGHEQVNYKAVATDSTGHQFEVFKRQNLRKGMENDFSCGIIWLAPNRETITLKRYNGPSHNHPNHLEKEKLGYTCHIHIATEKYIQANRKAEGFATSTERYVSVEGALHCLVTDCNISGISTSPDHPTTPQLFDR